MTILRLKNWLVILYYYVKQLDRMEHILLSNEKLFFRAVYQSTGFPQHLPLSTFWYGDSNRHGFIWSPHRPQILRSCASVDAE